MPKYYVESGRVRTILTAETARQAADKAIQRVRQRQSAIYAEPPSDTIRDAEAAEWQLGDEIRVSESGFGGIGCERFDAMDVATMAVGYSVTR